MDSYDEADWTEMDIEDLKAAIESGASIQEAADLLCRADGVEEVARKCEELGLKPKLQSWKAQRTSN
jgi:hypothetical protein